MPITSKIMFNWSSFSRSILDYGLPISVSGDKGKHDLPGKSGTLEKGSGKFYVIMLNSSAKMHPTDHMSIE